MNHNGAEGEKGMKHSGSFVFRLRGYKYSSSDLDSTTHSLNGAEMLAACRVCGFFEYLYFEGPQFFKSWGVKFGSLL
jgi:hypothetical protein